MEIDWPWFTPLVISAGVFAVSVVVLKLLGTFWNYTLLGAYSLATIVLVATRPYRMNGDKYDIDTITIIETTMVISTLIMFFIVVYNKICQANKYRKICGCCRPRSDLSIVQNYDDILDTRA
jgi:hypothetical protein